MFLAPIWKKLDEAVDELMAYVRDDMSTMRALAEDWGLTEIQGKCRGLAEALAVLMPPFFSTGDEIVREAMVRYQKRKAGEDYETPGIGRLRFALPPGAKEKVPSGMSHAHVVGTKHAPEFHPANVLKDFGLGEEKVAEIVEKSKAGFQPRMLAVVYGVEEKIINWIIKANG